MGNITLLALRNLVLASDRHFDEKMVEILQRIYKKKGEYFLKRLWLY